MTSGIFEVGDRVSYQSDQGEVVKVENRPGDQSDLLHILTDNGEVVKRPAKLPTIEKQETSGSLLEAGEFDEPDRFDLRTLAVQLDLAHDMGRFVALTNNRIDIQPYQVKAAYEVLTSYRHRYLIGDEVGLGKTIETGIAIEELITRDQADRVLIVTPAPLQTQWQNEMQEKFNRDYVIYDRDYVESQRNAHPNENAWMQENRIITSIDFAKQEDVLAALQNLEQEWDIAVFDEAHHLTARREGQTGINKTDRYRVGEAVSDTSDGLLFLTGTPHKGKSDQFYFMLRLLDRYRFEDEHDISPDRLRDIMIRRLKSQMYREDGSKMFPEKEIRTLPVHFSDEEQELYDSVTEYITEDYNLGDDEKNSASGFAKVLYQKRLVSSIHAIQNSLKNRLDSLRRGGTDPGELSDIVQQLLPKYRRDPDLLTDHQREKIERELEEVAVIDDTEQLEEEQEIVEELYNKARQVSTDSKAERLKEFVDGILENDPDEKILIFTEYTDTLEYLRDEIFTNYRTSEIYGDLNDEQRQEQVVEFEENSNLMLATDAAREGINLQFAHIMVNFDLPWSPIRIDQRIGRLHRYGQEHTVEIKNLFVDETRESEILETLFEKLEEIENEIGMRSDILGTVLDDFDLEDQLMQAAANEGAVNDVAEVVENRLDQGRSELREIEEGYLVSDEFDLEGKDAEIRGIIEKSREEAVSSDDIEQLVKTFFGEFDGEIRQLPDRPDVENGQLYRLEPPELLTGNNIKSIYEPATFSRQVAVKHDDIEFLALGHPLIQSLIQYCQNEKRTGGLTAIKVAAHAIETPGLLYNYRVECFDGTGTTIAEHLIPLYVTHQGEISRGCPELTGGLPAEKMEDHDEIKSILAEVGSLRKIADERVEEIAQELAAEARKDRESQIQARRENVHNYFENRRELLEERLSTYQEQADENNEDMGALINKTERELDELATEREEALERLETDETVTYDGPDLVNAAVVVTGLDQ